MLIGEAILIKKSTSGYTFLLNDYAIYWCSKKQSCISLLIGEAEYVACSLVAQEVVWLRRFLQDIEIVKTASECVTLYCDNMRHLPILRIQKYHGKTKHIHIRYHFFTDMIMQNEVVLKHMLTNKMVA